MNIESKRSVFSLPAIVHARKLSRLQVDAIVIAVASIVMIVFYANAISGQSVYIANRWYPTFGDDTYISMRYAKHLASGQGLVWNVGEAPIEGFTNFLWVLWIAVLTFLAEDPSYLIIWSAAVFHSLSVVLFYFFLRRSFHGSLFVAGSAVVLLTAWLPVRGWGLQGTEIPMLFFLFIAAIYFLFGDTPEAAAKRRVLIGCFFAGLLPLVRPDGLVLTFVLALGFALQYIMPTKPFCGQIQAWKWAFVCFVAPVIALTVFRLIYFGDWLPNTYYLKVYGRSARFEQGIDYTWRFLNSFYGSPFLILLLASAWFEKRRWVKAMAVGLGIIFLSVIYEGGDAFNQWRFFAPVLPVFLIFLSALTERFRFAQPFYAVAIGMWLWILPLGTAPLVTASQAEMVFPTLMASTGDNIRLGLLLARICNPETVTADFWAGATPYYSDLKSIDMLGKSDRHIAMLSSYKPGAPAGHDKFDFEYVLDRKPDVILSNHPLGMTTQQLVAVKSSDTPFGALLLENKRFQSDYIPVSSILSSRWHGIFRRQDSTACDWSRLVQEEYSILAYLVGNQLRIDGAQMYWQTPIGDVVTVNTPVGAEGRTGILFWTGQAMVPVSVEQTGNYSVLAHVRHSDPAPVEMAIGIDGKQLEHVTLSRGDNSWETIVLPVSLSRGFHSIDLWYLNDAVVDGKDRNAAVEWVTIEHD